MKGSQTLYISTLKQQWEAQYHMNHYKYEHIAAEIHIGVFVSCPLMIVVVREMFLAVLQDFSLISHVGSYF